jgi:hypothetical protein
MVVRGCRVQANQPPAALERDPRDIEIDDLRRQIKQLQERSEVMNPLNMMPLLMLQMLKFPATIERMLILFTMLVVTPRVIALHLILETKEFMVSNVHHYDVKVNIPEFVFID